MKIEFQDGSLLRIVDVEHDGDQVLLFDTVEENEKPGAMSVTSYPPDMADRIAEAISAQAQALRAQQSPMPPLLRLIERKAA